MHIQEVNLSYINVHSGRPQYGYFGFRLPSDSNNFVRWHKCREMFHMQADINSAKNKYWYATKRPEPVVKLIEVVETILGVEPTRFSVHWDFRIPHNLRTVYHGSYPEAFHLLQVEPSKFWLQQNMRHSFFTCVLRAGLNWDMKKNALKVLSEYQYFVNKISVSHFLNGRTWYTGEAVGWHTAFSPGSITHLYQVPNPENNLVDPPDVAVRGRAYYVWEEWGKPIGRESEIWHQAEKDIGVTRA